MHNKLSARLLGLLALWCLNGALLVLSGRPEKSERDQPKANGERIARQRRAALSSQRRFAQPAVLSTRDEKTGEVTTTLDVKFTSNEIDYGDQGKHTVRTRSYNGGLVGGIIRVRPGDLLKVRLKNSIPRCELDVPNCPNKPNGFNITNLHTHGLHVSPEGNSDNVFLEVGPEESKDLCFDIPPGHTAGTFWYHAHRHGSTALQLTSGMAGPLIVEGGLDAVPEIAEAMKDGREKIMVLQQITYSLNADKIGEVTKQDVYGGAKTRTARLAAGQQFDPTLINGIYQPVIKMKPGEVQRWRCIHAGVMKTIPLALVKKEDETEFVWLHEIAADGLPLSRMAEEKSLKLYPGYRSDFLVQAPPKAGTYLLKQLSLPAAEALNRVAQDEEYLARVDVEDVPPVAMKLPDPDAICKFALKPVDTDELVNRKPLPFVFKADESIGEFSINGDEFAHDLVGACPRLGTAEEWALSSKGDNHPFHIHVNPFEVIEKDPSGKILRRRWRDTLMVLEANTPETPLYIRMRFEKFPGKTVLHCHNLVHEDQGMMMAVRIVGKAPSSRCAPKKLGGVGALPATAPDWTLPDNTRKEHRLADLDGRNILLVFIRDMGCVHCRRQLEALARRREDFTGAGLTVVAVCPDSPEDISRALREDPRAAGLPFLVLSDVPLESFRRYGCHDGSALHGAFLIDGNRLIRWQDVAEEPFMDVDTLVREGRKLRAKRQSSGD